MPDDATTIEHNDPATGRPGPQQPKRHWRGRTIALAAGAALIAVGVVAGAGATRLMDNRQAQPLMPPVAISAMTDDSVVAVKGKVADIFGNKFLVEDQSGRMLVDTGPAGDGSALVARDETITVQGRFDDGFLHGSMIVHADGKTNLVGPAGGPPRHGLKGLFHRP